MVKTIIKSLKLLLIANVIFSTVFITLVYVNGLGCSFSMKYWLPDTPFDVYATCHAGTVNLRVSDKEKPSNTILELEGLLFPIFDYQMVYVKEIDTKNLNQTEQYPFKVGLENNFLMSSAIRRFNHKWVGVFASSPIDIAYLAQIDGYLNMQDRLRLKQD